MSFLFSQIPDPRKISRVAVDYFSVAFERGLSMMDQRASGILCHISSLPSEFGIGDLGPAAYRFVDFLAKSGQKYWQILPVNPTEEGLANSPYSSYSAFAFNPLFISPEGLADDGLLQKKDLEDLRLPAGPVDYRRVSALKEKMLVKAWKNYCARPIKVRAFENFRNENWSWLDDYAFFVVLRRKLGKPGWSDWPAGYRDRDAVALSDFYHENKDALDAEKFYQFLFYRQWMRLQDYCSRKGVGIIGDIPIYVTYDSVDVWVNSELFKLDHNKRMTVVAGVPPDYFSEEGQRWGNPVYDWDNMKAQKFDWWVERVHHNLKLFDGLRIDHFRGLCQCWEIPASEKTAKNGEWVDVPGRELLQALRDHFHNLPIIAEDLGIITPDVDALKEEFNLPGMRVMMFAFHNEFEKSRDIPENYVPLSVAYTGTHDNNTLQGWYRHDITEMEEKNMLEYFGRKIPAKDIHWVMIEKVISSKADLTIIPIQDVLGLGAESRMNKPSTVQENWQWRLKDSDVKAEHIERLKTFVKAAHR